MYLFINKMCNDGSSDYYCQQLRETFSSHLFKSDQINNSIEVIYQFLLHNDFNSTAKSLIQEAKKVGVKSSANSITKNKSFFMGPSEQILLSYKFGDGTKFFELWDRYIPDDIKTSTEYKILTFKLYVYFAILPKFILKSIKEDSSPVTMDKERCITELETDFRKNITRLHQYLSIDGKELKCETQLRAFFALPYIEDPLSDPLFHEIFDKTWSDELSMHLQEFVAKYAENSRDCEEIESRKLLEIDTAISIAPFKISDTCTSEKIVAKDNTLIIPNDRDMAGFFEDSKSEEKLSTYYEKVHSIESKSTQTNSDFIPNESQHYVVEDTDQHAICKCHHRSIQYNQELALTKSHLYNVYSNYKKLKSRFHKLHGDYHKLISVAAELTTVLENSIKGQPVDLQGMLESCMKIFPDLFNQNIRDEFQVKTQQSDITNIRDIVQPDFNIINISPKLLDFKKIKLHLISGNVKTKLLLLQALRWKITLSQPGERDEAIHEYISNDLLGLHGQIASDNGRSILPYLLIPENVPMPHPLQQSTARLLNTFASLQCGRDYLSMDSSIVRVIFNCLNHNCHDEVDALTYDMTLSTLQKLSLRKQQRLHMIENGLLEWLIRHLHDEINTMSFYRLKYATTLLMNLSLHKEAQIRISTNASLLISTFIILLAIDHPSVSPYVNGALNNFLANDLINEEARKVNLSSIIEQLCKTKTGEMRKYLEHILRVHRRECTNDVEEEALSDNDNEEFDILENELEENDPVKNHKEELYGDILLSTCYMIKHDALQKERGTINEVLEKTSDAKLLPLQKNKHDKFSSNNYLPLLSENTLSLYTTNQNEFNIIDENRKHVSHISSKYDKMKKKNKNALLEDVTVYLYENQTSKESSTMTLASLMTLDSTFENKKGPDKFSSIASLRNTSNNKNGMKFKCEKEEEAFLAKPKISRTPPHLH